MATLHKEVFIHAPLEQVWDAIRDIGALHTRLVPGFVVDTRVEDGVRIVTFGNGMTARETILSLDDTRHRLAWNAEGGRTTHYNAVLEAFSEADGTRVVWTTDLLPHTMSDPIAGMQDQALSVSEKDARDPLTLSHRTPYTVRFDGRRCVLAWWERRSRSSWRIVLAPARAGQCRDQRIGKFRYAHNSNREFPLIFVAMRACIGHDVRPGEFGGTKGSDPWDDTLRGRF